MGAIVLLQFSQKLTLFTTEVLAICKRDLKTGLAGESLVIVAWRRDYSLFRTSENLGLGGASPASARRHQLACSESTTEPGPGILVQKGTFVRLGKEQSDNDLSSRKRETLFLRAVFCLFSKKNFEVNLSFHSAKLVRG